MYGRGGGSRRMCGDCHLPWKEGEYEKQEIEKDNVICPCFCHDVVFGRLR
mgnify:CR=1 FL=1